MAAIVETVLAADPRRLIVIDSPPLLSSSDALALASLGGQAVFLVQAGVTSRAAVDEALRLLAGHPRPWLLLNCPPARGATPLTGAGPLGAARGPGSAASCAEAGQPCRP